MNFFDSDRYEYLYNILNELEDGGPELASQFESYFEYRNGNYYCSKQAEYEDFINKLFEGEGSDDFFGWSGYEQGKSTEGGGTF